MNWKRYIINVLEAIDQVVNALMAGDPDETISSRIGKAARGDFGNAWQMIARPFEILIDWIFAKLGQENHCRREIEADEGRDDLIFGGDA
jgi:hypothetical protein